jgi:PadR family transcriptional regulator
MLAEDSPDVSQLLKGVLDLAVLAVLAGRDSYGYDVVRRLREGGLPAVGDASVYGTLRRLYQGGALASYVVASTEGPNRRYYALTSNGREVLERSARAWRGVAGAVTALLDEAEFRRAKRTRPPRREQSVEFGEGEARG